MNRKKYILIAILCSIVQGAWTQNASTFGGGDGSVKNPYIINTADHWDQFANNVNGGTTYSDTYFQLDADISVTATVGTGTTGNNCKPFSGTFDGNGHTLTFNYDGSGEDIAPFRFIRNATISNLHVAGQIKTSGQHAGGLAGRTYGTTHIVGCRVSTIINSSVSGDGTHGGIVALKPDWSSAHLTIEGCVYDGKIVTTNGTTHCAGFVGYTSYGSLTIMNSIYAPAVPAEDETAVNSEYTFYRFNAKHKGTITLTNSYYTETLGEPQSKQALSIGFLEDVDITIVPSGNVTEYSASGITVYEGNPCMKYNDTVYAGSGNEVALTFTHNYVGCTVKKYRLDENSDAELTGDITNGYVLKMGSTNVVFGFSMTGPPLFFLEGNGTSDSPYIIDSTDVWDYVVSLVNFGQIGYDEAYYKLTNDITVTTMMGSESKRFKGHFDGNGKTMTVDYDTDEQFTALFRYVDGAEISNLHVAGTITTSKKFAAGFVANAQGSNTMTNCRSSVTINSTVSGDGTHGGFVAFTTGGQFTMKGCAFDGQMLGSSTNKCGGFVGWNETNGSPEGVVYFKNCFFAPTSITVGIEHTYARSRINDGSHVQMYYSNCRTSIGDNQQFYAYSISPGEGIAIEANQDIEDTYDVSGISIYNDSGMMYDGVLYARNTQEMSLNLSYTGAGSATGFTTTAGTLSGDDPFTLKMGTADAVINAIVSSGGSGWSDSGNGTSESPYIISTIAQWNELADKVNNGVFGFNTAYYQLNADISVTTMVGTEAHKFKGHFDGNGHTLTLSYGTADAPITENYCAPFRFIEGAEIHDLHIDGNIYTQNQFAAGLAGYALNNNTITNCLNSVTINSSVNGDGTHGGFVANCQNNADDNTYVTFTGCAFDGSLLGSNTDNCGGFVGWTEGNDWANVNIINCLFMPNEVTMDSDGSATFSRGRNNNWARISVENSYYIHSFGTMQGEMAYTTRPDNVTTVAITIAGITVYAKKTLVTDVAATGITPTTATISWTGSSTCSNYQVRYRVKKNTDIYSTGFEYGLPDDWTTFDNDDDEKNWTHDDGTKKGMAHDGSCCMYSASYINNYGALEPDNWLVSPKLTLSGTMRVWLKGQDEDDYKEHFAIYLSTAGGSKSDFLEADGSLKDGVITLVPETETTNKYQEYTADLSTYSGEGYIAIRHFNCTDQFYLVVDDFNLYDENAGGAWTTVSSGSPATITGLTPDTDYEYQVVYDFGGNTYYTSTATLTTLDDNIAPTDLSAIASSANTASLSWTGFGDSYNLRYSEGGVAKVTFYVSSDIWGDGSGYQMLLDKDHNTYGSVIPESGGLTGSGDASPETYANFEYKMPENADGALSTSNVVNGSDGNKSVTITIVAGIYDWCITNPTPDDRVWIASENGNVGGRKNDFVFEAGKHYTFTVAYNEGANADCVNMTIEDDETIASGDVKNVTDITSTSYNLSGLTASTNYTIYVQSVKGERTSEWSSVNFSTLNAGELYLYDDKDNSNTIAANDNQTLNVTLQGRTLWKDGDWNTLCLPFSVALEGSPLEGADVRTLSSSSFDSATGDLTLNFTDEGTVTTIEAGKPYIIKWSEGDNLVNPVFTGVSIKNTTANVTTEYVDFTGTFSPVDIYTAERTNLYLGSNNQIFYPWAEGMTSYTLKSNRAYFQLLNGLTAGEPTTGNKPISSFVLNFGENASSITEITEKREYFGSYYSLDGKRLSGKPIAKGIYIVNGKKVVVK